MEFKIIYPAGYHVNNLRNGCVDANIVFKNKKVYFATFITPSYIESTLAETGDVLFWSKSMLVVKYLSQSSIKKAVTEIYQEGLADSAFTFIGEKEEIYPKVEVMFN